jgi:hypothetical protein
MINHLKIKEGIFELEICESQEYKCYFTKIKKEGEVVWVEEFREKEAAIRIGKIVFSRIIDTSKYLGNKIDKPYTLNEHKRFIREMSKGKVSIEKFRANFERAVVSLKKDLEKLTKEQLPRRCRFIPVHWDILNEAYEVCLGRFAPGRVVFVKVYVDEDFVSAVRREVYNTKLV